MEHELSSRPLPVFSDDVKVFSTKKERVKSEHCFRPPPSPHTTRIKSALLSSRVRSRLPSEKPAVVSFCDNHSADSSVFLSNSFYDQLSRCTFLDQCFEQKTLIGSGCFGNVFSVRSKLDGRKYAVKQSRQPFKDASDRRRRLEEVRRQERLPRHRHCVRFYTAWEESDHLYLLTELCDRSLSAQSEQTPLAETTVWNYMIDLLLALQHLHSNRLMHLDVKPDNVFISRQGFCKLGDFGLVADIGDQSSVSTWAADLMEGDPRYLAPELMRGHFSPAADIFSLGVSLLEVSSDLDVPSGNSGWHQLRAGHQLPAALTGQLSRQLRQVLQLMLEPRPQLRPSARQLLQLPIVRRYRWRRAVQVQLLSLFWWFRDGVCDVTAVFYSYLLLFVSSLVAPWRVFNSLAGFSSCSSVPAAAGGRVWRAAAPSAVRDKSPLQSTAQRSHGADGDWKKERLSHSERQEFSDSDVDSPALSCGASLAPMTHSTPCHRQLSDTPKYTTALTSSLRRSRCLAPSVHTPLSTLALESDADEEEGGQPGAIVTGSRSISRHTVCDSPPHRQRALMVSTPASQRSQASSARSQRKCTPRNLARIFGRSGTEETIDSPLSSRCRTSTLATPTNSETTPTSISSTPSAMTTTPISGTPTFADSPVFGHVQSRLCFDLSDDEL